MKKSTNPNAVGVDAFFREIFAGDTIQDIDGIRYTVDKQGICTPLTGGSIRRLSAIKEPAVVGASAPNFAEGAGGKVGPAKPADETPAETQAETRETPAPEKKTPRGSRGPKSDATRDLMSEMRNKSGTAQIYNIVRNMGVHFNGTAARKLLEEAGIKTFADGAGRGCIKRDDFAKAQEIIRQAAADPARAKAVTAEPKPRAKAKPVTEKPAKVFPGEGPLAAIPDQQLADELRARGYTLTATKTVTQTIEL